MSLVAHAALLQFRREAHHDLGAAHHGDGVARVERSARNQCGDHADIATPSRLQRSTVTWTPDRTCRASAPVRGDRGCPPACACRRGGRLGRYCVALPQQVIERRPQRGQADAAGDDHDIAPVAPLRSANACRTDRGCPSMSPRFNAAWPWSRCQRRESVCTECRGVAGIAADRNRHFADAKDVEHVELARREGCLPIRSGIEAQGERVVRLPFDARDRSDCGGHGIVGDRGRLTIHAGSLVDVE